MPALPPAFASVVAAAGALPLDDFAGYLIRSRTTIGVPLCQDLALRLSLEITYDGDPPSGTEALDILGLVGVEYQF